MKWNQRRAMLLGGRIAWAPPDEGAGGDTSGGGGDSGSGEGEGQGDGAQSPGGDGTGEGGNTSPSRSSIMDFAPKGDSKGKAEGDPDAWKLPEGLELPDHLVGDSAEATLQKLGTAYKGARQELSTRKSGEGQLEGTVPAEAKDYNFDSIEGDPEKDPVLKDLRAEESQQFLNPFREAAKEIGIPDAAFAKFMHLGVTKMTEAGLSLATDPEEAARISGEAEMSGLVEALGQAGADEALRQIDTYAQKLADRGILQNQAQVEEFAQMVGTAEAAQIMQRIIVAEFGEKAIPRGDGVEGAPTVEEAYERHAAALAMKPGQDREDAVLAAEKALEKAMANQGSTPGQIKSKVL